jgi:hypothetical protein
MRCARKGGEEKWTLLKSGSKVKSSIYSCLELMQCGSNRLHPPSRVQPVGEHGRLATAILAFSELLKLAATSSRVNEQIHSRMSDPGDTQPICMSLPGPGALELSRHRQCQGALEEQNERARVHAQSREGETPQTTPVQIKSSQLCPYRARLHERCAMLSAKSKQPDSIIEALSEPCLGSKMH